VDPRAFQLLETPDVALMEYRTGQEPPVWLAQVAGFGTRAAFHPPELCYVGSHFEVLARVPIVLEAAGARRRVMRLVVAQGNERFEAWYWFTANGRVTPSYYRQQLWLVADTIRRRPVSGMLLRISTPIDDPTRTHQRLQTFVDAFLRAHGGFSSPIDA
jgi:EpsI family protein